MLFVDILFLWSITVFYSTGSHGKAQASTSNPTWNQACEGTCPFFHFVGLLPGIMTLLMLNFLFDGVGILGTWIVFGERQGNQSSWLQANHVYERCGEWKPHENCCCEGRCSAQVYQVLISEGRPCFVIKSSPLEMYIAFPIALPDIQKT